MNERQPGVTTLGTTLGAFFSDRRLWVPPGEVEWARLHYVAGAGWIIRLAGTRMATLDVHYKGLRLVENVALVGRWVCVMCCN